MNSLKSGSRTDRETGESLAGMESELNKAGILLRDNENIYRNFDDVLDEVGKRWRSLTQEEQNAVSIAVAGSKQRETFTSLMENYSKALQYSETSSNSAGAALEKYGIYQDSIEAVSYTHLDVYKRQRQDSIRDIWRLMALRESP